jgi:hypothetical protein
VGHAAFPELDITCVFVQDDVYKAIRDKTCVLSGTTSTRRFATNRTAAFDVDDDV